jgi:photosystem II stability/assembly factor-like uncharacterized protein
MKKAGNIIIIIIAAVFVAAAMAVFLRPHQKPVVIVKNQIESNLYAAVVLSEKDMLAAGELGRVYLSADAGKTWQEKETPTRFALLCAGFGDEKNGWMAGQAGTVIHTADGGKTWTAQKTGVESALLGFNALDALHACAVGADSTVVVTADGGLTWMRAAQPGAEPQKEGQAPASGFNIFGVRMMDANTICVAGYMGRIFISKDAGKSWSEMKSPLYEEENQVGRTIFTLSGSQGTMIASGLDTALILSKDNAMTWTETAAGMKEPEIFGIDLDGNNALAAGSSGTVLVSADAGTTWKMLDLPEMVGRAWLSDAKLKKTASGVKGLVVGQYGTIGIYDNGTVTWQVPVIPEVQ